MTDTSPLFGGLPEESWLLLHGVALSSIIASIIGSVTILVLTYRTSTLNSLTPVQKFPLFISLTDLLLGLIHGTDHAISLAKGRVVEGVACDLFGFGTVYFVNAALVWIGACASYIFMVVVRHYTPTFGRFDYRLHTFTWGIPLMIGLVGALQAEYGSTGVWCTMPGSATFFYNTVPIMLGLVFIGFFYIWTFLHIQKHQRAKKSSKVLYQYGMSGMNPMTPVTPRSPSPMSPSPLSPGGSRPQLPSPVSRTDREIQKTAYFLALYVLIYLIQWLPYSVYGVLSISGKHSFPLDIAVVLLSNAGGLFNALAYRRILVKTRKSQQNRHDDWSGQSSVFSKNGALQSAVSATGSGNWSNGSTTNVTNYTWRQSGWGKGVIGGSKRKDMVMVDF